MTWQFIFTQQYNQPEAKFFKSNSAIESHYVKVLELLAHNPYHPSLRLHALSGKLEGLHSVSINLNAVSSWSRSLKSERSFQLMWVIMMRFLTNLIILNEGVVDGIYSAIESRPSIW